MSDTKNVQGAKREQYDDLSFAPSGTYIIFEGRDAGRYGPFYGPFANSIDAARYLNEHYSDEVTAEFVQHSPRACHPNVMTVNKRDGSPAIVRDGDWFSRDGQSLTFEQVRQSIDDNTGGEPTRAAMARGLVPDSWPYRLYDETDDEMRNRLS